MTNLKHIFEKSVLTLGVFIIPLSAHAPELPLHDYNQPFSESHRVFCDKDLPDRIRAQKQFKENFNDISYIDIKLRAAFLVFDTYTDLKNNKDLNKCLSFYLSKTLESPKLQK